MSSFWAKFEKLPQYIWRHVKGIGGTVLIYHHIGKDTAYTRHLDITISTKEFRRQIDYLTKNYRVIPFSDFVSQRFDPHCVAITFDDGYRSVLDVALPILQEYSCPFKIYLNSQQVAGELGWLNKLSAIIDFLSSANRKELGIFAQEALPNRRVKEPVKAFEYWRYFEFPRTLSVIDAKFSELNLIVPSENLFLSEADIRLLAAESLVEFGSHTEQHWPLDRLPLDQLSRTIRDGHESLRPLLGSKLEGFAVPFGTDNFRTKSIAKAVATVDPYFISATGRRNFYCRVGPLPEIQRLAVDGDLASLQLKMQNSSLR